ncbi:MAG: M23 family metallopeptidase [Akkermansiaceae bacterium]|nr:M23 family metallopeptidase [Akkermansiaceae bacterium]
MCNNVETLPAEPLAKFSIKPEYRVTPPPSPTMRNVLRAALIALAGTLPAFSAEDLIYRLPTENDALFRNADEDFYMYCERWVDGKLTKPYQAGTYGYTRTPIKAHNGTQVFTQLHEGIDIKPVRRDAEGEPLDEVHPVAPGVVAYVCDNAGASNYGKYVVIAHNTPEGTIYSLYAHLKTTTCETGQQVTYGDTIGILGYTGKGIPNNVRAHCHLELCLMVHSEFYKFGPAANKHGLFHGHNLIGFNAADALLACKDGRAFSIEAYFATLEEHYRVRVPRVEGMDILERHPFLYKGDWSRETPALEIAFTAAGLPIAIYPSATETTTPTVTRCKPMPVVQKHCTSGRINGNSKTAHLTASGKTFISRFLWKEAPQQAPAPPEAP